MCFGLIGHAILVLIVLVGVVVLVREAAWLVQYPSLTPDLTMQQRLLCVRKNWQRPEALRTASG